MAANPLTESGLDLSWLNLYDDAASATPGKKGLTLKEINSGRYGDLARGAGDMTYRMRGAGPAPWRAALRPDLHVRSPMSGPKTARCSTKRPPSASGPPRATSPGTPSSPCPMRSSAPCASSAPCSPKSSSSPATSPDSGCRSSAPRTSKPASSSCPRSWTKPATLDVFRKRALANGGGLLAQGAGLGLRTLLEARDFTEMSVLMHVQAEGFVQSHVPHGRAHRPDRRR